MRVVCIKKYVSRGLQYELTYGREYDASISTINGIMDNCYIITNDRGLREWYYKTDFVTLEEWRELKLKELGI